MHLLSLLLGSFAQSLSTQEHYLLEVKDLQIMCFW